MAGAWVLGGRHAVPHAHAGHVRGHKELKVLPLQRPPRRRQRAQVQAGVELAGHGLQEGAGNLGEFPLVPRCQPPGPDLTLLRVVIPWYVRHSGPGGPAHEDLVRCPDGEPGLAKAWWMERGDGEEEATEWHQREGRSMGGRRGGSVSPSQVLSVQVQVGDEAKGRGEAHEPPPGLGGLDDGDHVHGRALVAEEAPRRGLDVDVSDGRGETVPAPRRDHREGHLSRFPRVATVEEPLNRLVQGAVAPDDREGVVDVGIDVARARLGVARGPRPEEVVLDSCRVERGLDHRGPVRRPRALARDGVQNHHDPLPSPREAARTADRGDAGLRLRLGRAQEGIRPHDLPAALPRRGRVENLEAGAGGRCRRKGADEVLARDFEREGLRPVPSQAAPAPPRLSSLRLEAIEFPVSRSPPDRGGALGVDDEPAADPRWPRHHGIEGPHCS